MDYILPTSTITTYIIFRMSGHSDHSSSSDDAISENNEYDKKCRKLDYLIDSADDGSGGEVRRACQISAETPEFSNIDRTSYLLLIIIICWLYFMLPTILMSKERFAL